MLNSVAREKSFEFSADEACPNCANNVRNSSMTTVEVEPWVQLGSTHRRSPNVA